jgi:hypothetical protein
MNCYAIRDQWTEIWWSRNEWGSVKSIPDLYQTKQAAQNQIDRGKISVMICHDLRIGDQDRRIIPEIVDMELSEVYSP